MPRMNQRVIFVPIKRRLYGTRRSRAGRVIYDSLYAEWRVLSSLATFLPFFVSYFLFAFEGVRATTIKTTFVSVVIIRYYDDGTPSIRFRKYDRVRRHRHKSIKQNCDHLVAVNLPLILFLFTPESTGKRWIRVERRFYIRTTFDYGFGALFFVLEKLRLSFTYIVEYNGTSLADRKLDERSR